ncbi:MAG: peroxiredoxin [Candidatus Schekmanbacteria bacterium]|nr:MAG: peroxiredoxin [Candidatus Schekmanbacteria bacterium]
MAVKVGELAPDFTMEGVYNEKFKKYTLKKYRGKWVVLFFYPLDFTFVCPTEITEFSRNYEKFKKLNAEVFGVSTDSKFSHLAWIERDLKGLKYPLLSDTNHKVSRDYGVLIEEEGIALRGLFIIDPDGKLRYQVVHDLSVGRNVNETLRVLEALQTGELCPVNWEKGKKTLGKA